MLPIEDRPNKPIWTYFGFACFFLSSVVSIHLLQLLLTPLAILPYTRQLCFWPAIAHTKRVFASLLVFITQQYAPTRFVVSAEEDQAAELYSTDASEGGVKVLLPSQHGKAHLGNTRTRLRCFTVVMISNHQIYTDWMYLWSLLHLAEIPSGVIIVLKASLRKLPVIGLAMQFFNFIVHPPIH